MKQINLLYFLSSGSRQHSATNRDVTGGKYTQHGSLYCCLVREAPGNLVWLVTWQVF